MKKLNWIKQMLKVVNMYLQQKKKVKYKEIKVDHGQGSEDAVRKRYRRGKKQGKRR
jgi:hypothetical protein